MIPLSDLVTVQPRSELYDTIQEMTQDGYNQLPVVEAGQIQGMLTREDVITYLQKLQTRPTQHKSVFGDEGYHES